MVQPNYETMDPVIMEQLLKLNSEANEPGTLQAGTVIDNGQSGENLPLVAGTVTSAGYVTVYRTNSGEPSVVNRNMLPRQLLKRDPETGALAFSMQPPPGIKPYRGSMKCMLHSESPNREYYSSLGLGVCRKSQLPNQHQVVSHMRHRHPQEWDTIERDRVDRERREDRDSQLLMQQAIMQLLAQQQPAVAAPENELKFSEACGTCGVTFGGNSKASIRSQLATHHREEHS